MSGTALLSLYRSATRFAEPVGPFLLRRRFKRGKEDGERLPERLGFATLPRPDGPLAWVHGASVGEGIALLPIMVELVSRGFAVLATTGTLTSSRVLSGRLPAGVLHQFVPIDLPGAARRFLDHWRPDLVCFAESELWPNLIAEVERRGVPAALVNARMSARSFKRWRRVPSFIRPLLRAFTVILAQSESDAARFARLGARQVIPTGNLKFDVPPPGADPAALTALKIAIGNRPLWIAASTHEGEEALCCAAHRQAATYHPKLLTVIVPRKPDRGAAIATLAEAQRLVARQRSRGQMPDRLTELYIADTIGEIGLFYRLASIVFMGKSLVGGGGGQNPIEPAKLGSAILHGPAVGNFAEVYDLLDASGGGLAVADALELGDTVAALLDRPGKAADMAERAADAVAASGGAVARTMASLEPIIDPILHVPVP